MRLWELQSIDDNLTNIIIKGFITIGIRFALFVCFHKFCELRPSAHLKSLRTRCTGSYLPSILRPALCFDSNGVKNGRSKKAQCWYPNNESGIDHPSQPLAFFEGLTFDICNNRCLRCIFNSREESRTMKVMRSQLGQCPWLTALFYPNGSELYIFQEYLLLLHDMRMVSVLSCAVLVCLSLWNFSKLRFASRRIITGKRRKVCFSPVVVKYV